MQISKHGVILLRGEGGYILIKDSKCPGGILIYQYYVDLLKVRYIQL